MRALLASVGLIGGASACQPASGTVAAAELAMPYGGICIWVNDQYRYVYEDKIIVDDFTALTVNGSACSRAQLVLLRSGGAWATRDARDSHHLPRTMDATCAALTPPHPPALPFHHPLFSLQEDGRCAKRV
jgi:hypothetical protein